MWHPDGPVWDGSAALAAPFGFLVDATGRRFTNESASGNDICRALYARARELGPGAIPAWLILDAEHRRRYPLAGQEVEFRFNTYWNEGDIGMFQYETKWSSNIEVVQAIAEYYHVNFVQDYEEMSNLIYGKAIFYDKLLTDIYLEDEDFARYQFDEETDTYHFENEEHESNYEILETLLKRKIASI